MPGSAGTLLRDAVINTFEDNGYAVSVSGDEVTLSKGDIEDVVVMDQTMQPEILHPFSRIYDIDFDEFYSAKNSPYS